MNSEQAAEQLAKAEQTFRLATDALQKQGARAFKGSVNFEQNYGAAFQELVRLGARPQLRKKYRGVE
jgi:hypothetical protein